MSARAPSRARPLGWVPWVLMAIIATTALAIGAVDDGGPRTDSERAGELAREIRCPQCLGESVAESNVAIAREIRADISRRVDAGQTDDEIRTAYVDLYNQSILLTPPGSGFSSLVWVIPVVGGAAAAGVLGFAFWRWRRLGDAVAASEDDRRLVAEALAGGRGHD
ncbi:MAG: cytochrome c-type biogenesis protein CcmH [Acidimicrobiales bacterium]